MPEACADCLRRGALVGRLAPAIARLLDAPRPRPAGLLALDDRELIDVVAGRDAAATTAWLARWDHRVARAELEQLSLDCVCRHSDLFPSQLRDLDDPPSALYLTGDRGRLASLGAEPCATVVGGRGATPYALEVARDLGRGLAAAGVTVVSGLALGVDAAAHRGALAGAPSATGVASKPVEPSPTPAPAIGVLAGGVEVASPRANRALYERLRERGVVVSELPPGTRPAKWSFPARNRIMAALGAVCVVVEAQCASGSLITAAFASDLGRDVRVMPGQVTSPKAAGSNELLRDGAGVIRGAEDVLDDLFGVVRGDAGELSDEVRRRRALVRGSLVGFDGPLDASARRVLSAIEAGCEVSGIGAAAGLPPSEVRGALGMLELMGLVRRDGLGAYERAPGPVG